MRSVIIVGPDYTEAEIATREGASPAAAAWMRMFIGLVGQIARIRATVWFAAESAWPRGRLSVGAEQLPGVGRERFLVGYCNIPRIKVPSISGAVADAVLRMSANGDDVVVYGQKTLMPADIKRIAGKVRRVFLIVPDAELGRGGEERIVRAARHATGGVIYLPTGLPHRLPEIPALSLQGVVRDRQPIAPVPSECGRKLVFVGGVDRFSGAHFLREALETASLPDCRIIVMGHIADRATAARLGDLGADVTGFVEFDRMETECRSALAFLNPRDPRMAVSARNFPSKLLLYMRFPRPIVSTDTLGMPRSLVRTLECEGVCSPADFARQMEVVAASGEGEIGRRIATISAFVEEELSENVVLQKLEEFIAA